MHRIALLVAFMAFPGMARTGHSAMSSSPRAAPSAPVRDTLHLGASVITIEIAASDTSRTRGLSGRRSMGWNEGMLFAFPDAQHRAFWMIDCFFDLDIAYIAPDGTIRDIQTMVIEPGVAPQNLARYPSRSTDVMYALEMNRGWFVSHGIRVGQRIPGILRHRTRH